jgi:hypothetical protein
MSIVFSVQLSMFNHKPLGMGIDSNLIFLWKRKTKDMNVALKVYVSVHFNFIDAGRTCRLCH